MSEHDRRHFYEKKKRVKERSFMRYLYLRVWEEGNPYGILFWGQSDIIYNSTW